MSAFCELGLVSRFYVVVGSVYLPENGGFDMNGLSKRMSSSAIKCVLLFCLAGCCDLLYAQDEVDGKGLLVALQVKVESMESLALGWTQGVMQDGQLREQYQVRLWRVPGKERVAILRLDQYRTPKGIVKKLGLFDKTFDGEKSAYFTSGTPFQDQLIRLGDPVAVDVNIYDGQFRSIPYMMMSDSLLTIDVIETKPLNYREYAGLAKTVELVGEVELDGELCQHIKVVFPRLEQAPDFSRIEHDLYLAKNHGGFPKKVVMRKYADSQKRMERIEYHAANKLSGCFVRDRNGVKHVVYDCSKVSPDARQDVVARFVAAHCEDPEFEGRVPASKEFVDWSDRQTSPSSDR